MMEFENLEIPEKFKKELRDLDSMMKENKPQLEIDNEVAKMKERYGLDSILNNRGYKNLKKILDKFWSGKRLDDQELSLAYILCPKIILYEDIQFRIFDMIHEIEEECRNRWGSTNSPINASVIVKNMVEPNPNYTKSAIPIIDTICKRVSLKVALENWEKTVAYIEQEKTQ